MAFDSWRAVGGQVRLIREDVLLSVCVYMRDMEREIKGK